MSQDQARLPQVRQLAEALASRRLSLGGRRVLDVGCGNGASLAALEALGAVGPLGLDPRLPAPAAERRWSARLGPGDGAALPYADASFDALVFFFSLHHIPRPDRALGEAARVLRAGGLACFAEPVAEGSMYELERWIDDEAAIRAEAQAVLDLALSSGPWQQVLTCDYHQIEPYQDLSIFIDEMLAVGGDLAAARAARVVHNRDRLEAAFAAVPDGRFQQGYLLRVLQRLPSRQWEATL